MRTLLLTLEYPPFRGGVANYYGNIVKYWPEADNFSVLTDQDKLIISKLPFFKWLPAISSIERTVRRRNINYIIVGQILPLGTAVYLLSKFLKIKYAVILHGLDFSSAVSQPRKKWLAKKILNRADKIICTNNYTAELVGRFTARNDVKTVNPGVEPDLKFNRELYRSLIDRYGLTDKIILLSVGRLVERKGFATVINILPQALNKIPALVYVILGHGPELTALKAKISDLDLGDKIRIIADANDNERNAWLDLCHIFIMPSKNLQGDFEGFGIVFLEANLAGKPVIAGRSGGVPDAVIDGINGLLVDPDNENEIEQAVIKLAKDEFLRKKLGEQGKRRAITEFGWQKQIGKLYSLINDNF